MALPNWSSSVALNDCCVPAVTSTGRRRNDDRRGRLVDDDGDGVGGHVAGRVGHGRGKDVGAGRVEGGGGVLGGIACRWR